MKLTEWQENNNSFKKTLVFHFGTGAGFYSEYNNMLKAIVYCYVHKIRFVLYSKDATFGIDKGWQDYFLPFCDEVTNDFHAIYNRRFLDQPQTKSFNRYLISIYRAIKYCDRNRLIKYTNFKKSSEKIRKIKKKYQFDYFTYDLWYDFTWYMPIYRKLKIKDCNWKNVKQALSEVDDMIWHLNDKALVEYNKIKDSIILPDIYYGMQIRAGDKFREAEPLTIDQYFSVLNKLSPSGGTVFLLTDDYQIYELAAMQYTQWRIISLCQPYEKGFFNDVFNLKNDGYKYFQLTKLFVSINILTQSESFVGTKSANPGQYLQIRMPKEKFFNIDSTY